MSNYRIDRHIARIAIRVLIASSALLANVSYADVKLPNGEYRETVTDLRVKVLGGYVAVERTWLAENLNKGKYRWYVNPAWADLSFEYDDLDGSVKSVRRADSKFERAGNDVFVFERVYFIAKKDGGWRWYDRDGNWVRYDDKGRITAYGDRNDVTVHVVRSDPDGPITSLKDHHDKLALTLEYTEGKLTSVNDRAGRKVVYRYEGDALAEVTDVDGYGWSYGYTNGLMTRKTDPENHATAIEYSGNRVVKVTDARLQATTYEYAYDRGKRTYTIVEKSPEGVRVERRYDAEGRLIRQVDGTRETFSLQRDGIVADAETDERGGRTRRTYDANGNAIKVVSPDGTVATAKYHAVFRLPVEEVDALGVKTLYDYDGHGNLKTLTEAAGTAIERVTTSVYDDLGQLGSSTVKGRSDNRGTTVVWTYDEFGNVATSRFAGEPAVAMTYDVMGNVLTLTDARGKVTTSAYDRRGHLTSSKDPLQHETVYEYDRVGNRKRVVDPAGYETLYTYDENNRPKSVVAPARPEIVYDYDNDGRIESSGAEGTTTTYDGDGRVGQTQGPFGGVTHFVYGDTGGPEAGLVKRLSGDGFCEDYSYDQQGRSTRAMRYIPCEGADRRVETFIVGYDANGRRVSTIDPRGRTTLYAYDALGRLHAMTDPAGGTTTFEYDAGNRRVAVTDANGGTHRYAYDDAGRLVSAARPSGAATRYKYDAAGNPVERISASGKRRTYAYDDAGRRVGERRYPAASNTPSQIIEYAYDARGLLAGYTQSGDTSSRAVYEYDGAGARVSETLTYGSGGAAFEKKWSTSYWPNGRHKLVAYPENFPVAYAYDDKERIASLTLPGSGTIAWSDYEGRIARRMTTPGTSTTLTIDRTHRQVRTRVESTGGSGVMDLADTYDEAGNVAARTLDAASYSYAYDALDHLAQVTAPAGGDAGERYEYDNVHNRKSSQSQPGPWAYDVDNRLLVSGLGADEMHASYDDDGNTSVVLRGPTSSPVSTVEHVYDAAERLSEVRRNGVTIARYQYDPFGRRIRKETADGVTWFQYLGERLAAEFSAGGQVLRYYGWDIARPDTASPLFIADRVDGAWRYGYFHNDVSGTPKKITDAAGAVVWSARSTAFGATTVDASSTLTNPLRFPGQYEDAETGNHYNLNRYYVPSMGRYLETDPIGLAGGINTYAYVGGNPLRFVDPNGLMEADIQFVLGQVLRSFPELAPRGALVCGKLTPKMKGDTSRGHTVGLIDRNFPQPEATMVVDVSWCVKRCLTREEWEELMKSIFHEAMHSTDPWWVGGDENETAVHNRTEYEFDFWAKYNRKLPDPIWGTPLPPPGLVRFLLYEEYRRGMKVPCKSCENKVN